LAPVHLHDSLLSGVRENGWQLAEIGGDAIPYGMQHLPVRGLIGGLETLYTYVGDLEGSTVIDEVGFSQKGTHSVGMAR